MTTLAQQIATQQNETIVLGSQARRLTAVDLRSIGVAQDLGPDTRLALKLHDPLDVIRALAALDGQVAAILLVSHALEDETAQLLARAAECSLFVTDSAMTQGGGIPTRPLEAVLGLHRQSEPLVTDWLMTTSGTTGVPKIVPHSLRSLARSVYRFGIGKDQPAAPVWGLLYDPTRFAGLQVVLQALIGGGQLIAVDASRPLADQVAVLAENGCTHLSATPTLWRRLLMLPGHDRLTLRQITLGGEIADQPTLNALRLAFPSARLSHIYASTEAGVGFSVIDGLAGFPRSYLEKAPGNVSLKIVDDILWLRPPLLSPTTKPSPMAMDAEGYINSGDQVSLVGDRGLFLGRESGLINIGGVKVYPETVEAVIKTVPGVALVQVSAKRSPLTGALVVAEVQLAVGAEAEATRQLIQAACRGQLVREATPAIIRFVAGFTTNAAGKLVRKGS